MTILPLRAPAVAAVVAMAVVATAAAAQRAPSYRRPIAELFAVGGERPERPDRHTFTTVSAVDVTSNGYIVVLDSARGRVNVLGMRGELLWHFPIDGPGELSAPVELSATDSTVAVRDATRNEWHWFTLHGTRIDSRPAAPLTTGRDRLQHMRGGITIIDRSPPGISLDANAPSATFHRSVGILSDGGADPEWLFSIRTATVVLRVTPARSRLAPWQSSHDAILTLPANARFGASGAWTHLGDSVIAFADGYTGNVTWYSLDERGAIVVERAHLGRVGRPISEAELASEAEYLRDGHEATSGPAGAVSRSRSVAALTAAPPQWSVATRAVFASDGSLWVGVNRIYTVVLPQAGSVRVGDDNTWAVFAPDGTAFTVTLRPLFWVIAVRGDRVYGVVEDGGSAPLFVAYSLK